MKKLLRYLPHTVALAVGIYLIATDQGGVIGVALCLAVLALLLSEKVKSL